MTWQSAARGVPLWVGCRIVWVNPGVPTNGRPMFYVGVEDDDLIAMQPGPFTYGSRYVHSGGRVVPDLEDPDTRAMYLRRLAVALGCPEDLADECVGFILYGSWTVVSGCPDNDGAFPWSVAPESCRDAIGKIEALALAWPADKRVTG